jgi:trk system potassium uptake protein TrkH
MFVGGASGSTAGGVKLATMAIILIGVYSTIKGHAEPQVFNRRVSLVVVMRALAVVTIFLLIFIFLTFSIAVTEHYLGDRPPFVALMFETMSAQATVGLSTGITPSISTAGKLILVLAMFVGRLGPLTIVYALQVRQERRRYRYPEEPVHIG